MIFQVITGFWRRCLLFNYNDLENYASRHYLGYKTLVGAQMRYAVRDRNGWPIAMLGFSTAAWKLAPRDNFIGWTPCQRRREYVPERRRKNVIVSRGVV